LNCIEEKFRISFSPSYEEFTIEVVLFAVLLRNAPSG
jgi:hypothetical protein